MFTHCMRGLENCVTHVVPYSNLWECCSPYFAYEKWPHSNLTITFQRWNWFWLVFIFVVVVVALHTASENNAAAFSISWCVKNESRPIKNGWMLKLIKLSLLTASSTQQIASAAFPKWNLRRYPSTLVSFALNQPCKCEFTLYAFTACRKSEIFWMVLKANSVHIRLQANASWECDDYYSCIAEWKAHTRTQHSRKSLEENKAKRNQFISAKPKQMLTHFKMTEFCWDGITFIVIDRKCIWPGWLQMSKTKWRKRKKNSSY